MKPVRTSAKAIIQHNGALLLVRCVDEKGDWYLFPGGGQDHGESLRETLRREVREETGLEIEPGELAFVRDYISRNHEFAETDPDAHQVELYFHCKLLPGNDTTARNGETPDGKQTGVDWIPLERLGEIRVYPKCLNTGLPERVCYLGDIN